MKQFRQNKILELIGKYPIETQEELLNRLKECGYDVTQATVSRDIKKLRLYKSHDMNGRYRYICDNKSESISPGIQSMLSSTVLSIDYAMNDVVIKCRPGMASAVCATVDAMAFENVLGTVAGDDTILIIVKSESDAQEVFANLNDIINM